MSAGGNHGTSKSCGKGKTSLLCIFPREMPNFQSLYPRTLTLNMRRKREKETDRFFDIFLKRHRNPEQTLLEMFDMQLVAETFPTETLLQSFAPQSWPGTPIFFLPPCPLLAARSQASCHPVDSNSSSRQRPVSPSGLVIPPLLVSTVHMETKRGRAKVRLILSPVFTHHTRRVW